MNKNAKDGLEQNGFILRTICLYDIDDVLFSKSFFKPISLFLFHDLNLFYDEEKNKRNVICFI